MMYLEDMYCVYKIFVQKNKKCVAFAHILLTLCSPIILFNPSDLLASNGGEVLVVISSSVGDTCENARDHAIHIALEQTLGVFIQSESLVSRNNIIIDKIAKINYGNVLAYDIIEETKLPGGGWSSTLRVKVSVGHMVDLIKSSGDSVEFEKNIFHLNDKQQQINDKQEVVIVNGVISVVNDLMQRAYDYKINVGSPKILDDNGDKWSVPITVTSSVNSNYDLALLYFDKIISSIALSSSERESYVMLGKSYHTVRMRYNGKVYSYCLRSKISCEVIGVISESKSWYKNNFIVSNGVKDMRYPFKVNFYDKSRFVGELDPALVLSIYDPRVLHGDGVGGIVIDGDENIVESISFSDVIANCDLDRINKYEVRSSGPLVKFKEGGFVLYEYEGHGVVVCPGHVSSDQQDIWDFIYSKQYGGYAGYENWRAPTLKEIEMIHDKHYIYGINAIQRSGGYDFIWVNKYKKSLGGFLAHGPSFEEIGLYDMIKGQCNVNRLYDESRDAVYIVRDY